MQNQDQQTIEININLNRGLVILLTAILLVTAILTFMSWNHGEANAAGEGITTVDSGNMRQYYRTKDSYYPTEAVSACSTGYHFASLWEILEPSNLSYNSIIGDYQADSGYGPLTSRRGWVRTGYNSDSTGIPGQNNCLAWSTNDGAYQGTTAELPDQWKSVDPNEIPNIGVWIVGNNICSVKIPVWCVED